MSWHTHQPEHHQPYHHLVGCACREHPERICTCLAILGDRLRASAVVTYTKGEDAAREPNTEASL